jgi:hypothetical protein
MGWSPFRKLGLTFDNPALSAKGYTLATPMGGDASYLLDMAGRVVHRWRFTTIRSQYGRLLPNGRLLMLGTDLKVRPPEVAPGTIPPFDVSIRRIGGNATHLVEVDWDGNVVWSYEEPTIHHDFARLPNGNTLLLGFTEMPPEAAKAVRGGYRARGEKTPPLISDDIIEVDPAGKEVRRIHLWQLLDPVRDPICPLERRTEWTHGNALDVTPSGDILFSCRNNSRVGLIDSAGAKLLWKYGFPDVSHQHHATVLPNGNVQIFDNGMHRLGVPRSAVVEVSTKDSSTVWRYVANPEIQFLSANISGAERLPNGNVLICEGATGRTFEVTRAGEVAWEWINPFVTTAPTGERRSMMFRAHRYSLDHPAFAGHELDPRRWAEINRAYGLDT